LTAGTVVSAVVKALMEVTVAKKLFEQKLTVQEVAVVVVIDVLIEDELSSESVERLEVSAESAYQHFKGKRVEIGHSGHVTRFLLHLEFQL